MQPQNTPVAGTTGTTGGSGSLSYEQAGVNYDLIDPLKIAAQRAAAATAGHLAPHGRQQFRRLQQMRNSVN